MPLPDRERFRLLHGPYNAPKTRIGGTLTCLVRGRVRVDGFSTARTPWPITKPPKRGGRKGLILCGDLVRAVRMESAQAVAFWWGVSSSVVQKWRRALGVERNNDGSQKLRVKLWKDGGVGKAIHEGRDRLFTPEEPKADFILDELKEMRALIARLAPASPAQQAAKAILDKYTKRSS